MSRICLSCTIMVLLSLPLAGTYGQGNTKQTTRKPPSPIAIYDAYKVQAHTRKFGEDPLFKKNALNPVGAKKTVSTLKNSTASQIPCNSSWGEQAVKNLKKGYASTMYPELDLWRRVSTVQKLTPLRCATIDFPDYSLALIYFSLVADAVDRGDKPRAVVWFSKIDRKTSALDGLLYAGVSIESVFETKRNLTVEAIADTNEDGSHEIILHDERYSGDFRSVYFFNKKGLSGKQELPADSWN